MFWAYVFVFPVFLLLAFELVIQQCSITNYNVIGLLQCDWLYNLCDFFRWTLPVVIVRISFLIPWKQLASFDQVTDLRIVLIEDVFHMVPKNTLDKGEILEYCFRYGHCTDSLCMEASGCYFILCIQYVDHSYSLSCKMAG